MKYQDLKTTLSTARNRKAGKPIANNTRIFDRGDYLAIRLHNTDILCYFPNGDIRLDSGGWQTVTTKARMNEYAPCHIYSERGIWFISYENNTYGYADGMTLHPDGSVSGAQSKAAMNAQKQLRKNVAKYAKGFVRALKAGKVGPPGAGDCWVCCGLFGGPDHIHAHLEEKYYVPRLAYEAVNKHGSIAEMDTLYGYMTGDEKRIWNTDFMPQQIERHIRKHCFEQLGLAR